jgi:putative membrane protein
MLLQKSIPIKYIFGKIKYELGGLTLFVSALAVIHGYFDLKQLSIPVSVPMILGTIISMLLAFRSNQAYDRWWEARSIWGAIVNDSRSLARQINTFVKGKQVDDDEEVAYFKNKFINRQIGWCHSVSKSLRKQDGLQGMEKYLKPTDIKHLKNYTNKPAAMLELHGYDLQQAMENGWLNPYQQMDIDKTLSRLCDSLGKCERIKNTVFPSTYSLYIHASLMLFFILLPFSLIEFFGYFTIPLVIAIGTIFFLVEKMAIHLQDPFENKPTDTPTTTICLTIERDLKQMINEAQHQDEKIGMHKKAFYVM